MSACWSGARLPVPADSGSEAKAAGRARYEIESLRGFDFFPQTGHVEGVAILSRVEGKEEVGGGGTEVTEEAYCRMNSSIMPSKSYAVSPPCSSALVDMKSLRRARQTTRRAAVLRLRSLRRTNPKP